MRLFSVMCAVGLVSLFYLSPALAQVRDASKFVPVKSEKMSNMVQVPQVHDDERYPMRDNVLDFISDPSKDCANAKTRLNKNGVPLKSCYVIVEANVGSSEAQVKTTQCPPGYVLLFHTGGAVILRYNGVRLNAEQAKTVSYTAADRKPDIGAVNIEQQLSKEQVDFYQDNNYQCNFSGVRSNGTNLSFNLGSFSLESNNGAGRRGYTKSEAVDRAWCGYTEGGNAVNPMSRIDRPISYVNTSKGWNAYFQLKNRTTQNWRCSKLGDVNCYCAVGATCTASAVSGAGWNGSRGIGDAGTSWTFDCYFEGRGAVCERPAGYYFNSLAGMPGTSRNLDGKDHLTFPLPKDSVDPISSTVSICGRMDGGSTFWKNQGDTAQ